MVEGKVYTAQISRRELPGMKEKYPVQKSILLEIMCRSAFLAEEFPFKGAVFCQAGTEDAYLYLMEKKAGERIVL